VSVAVFAFLFLGLVIATLGASSGDGGDFSWFSMPVIGFLELAMLVAECNSARLLGMPFR